jgi:hypothetical protein
MPPDPLFVAGIRDRGFSANVVTKSVIGSLKIYKSFLSASSQTDRKKKAMRSARGVNDITQMATGY